MREIKFRVWDGDSQEMVVDGVGLDINGIAYVDNPLNGDFTYYPDCPVMQYAGRKDKNGVEIYEGDIVEIQHPAWIERCEVIFRDCCFTLYQLRPADGNHTLVRMSAIELREQWKLEVIGNMYENPDLLN